jgi:hypothetical protein
LAAQLTSPANTAIGKALSKAAREKHDKSPTMAKALSGGAYRVPQKGQLQVIIKNPNKTAVKLFLVPYDLEGMVPGMKTFVRQRSYSSGPILEAATPEGNMKLAARDPLSTKDILRYLIHLKFCCTSKGRYYLYDNIRVVFANRVPDGKEKLRNEIQLPEPKFSPHMPPVSSHSRTSSATEDKASILFGTPVTPEFERLDHILHSPGYSGLGVRTLSSPSTSVSMTRLPDSRPELPRTPATDDSVREQTERTVSPTPGFLPSTSSRASPISWLASNGSPVPRGFSPTPVEAGHGLLSRKLKELNENSSQ